MQNNSLRLEIYPFSCLPPNSSRKREYEADRYAVITTGEKDALITVLKKLSVDNLSNLTPHSLKVFFYYSHPPILERTAAIEKIELSWWPVP